MTLRRRPASIALAAAAATWAVGLWALPSQPPAAATPAIQLLDRQAEDQDDMCIWIHPTDRSASTVIASDKEAGRVFVYDLGGRTLQTLEVVRPGNIDVRYGFGLGDRRVDIVALNQRAAGPRIVVFAVDPGTRQLTRVDTGDIWTSESVGGALYRSRRTGKLFFTVTSDEEDANPIEQFELYATPDGRVAGRRVRSWVLGPSEAAVADDELGWMFIAEEDRGVWRLGAEPDEPAPGTLVIRTGEHGLVNDVEGLAIYRTSNRDGYLLVSNQSRHSFQVYRRESPHGFVGSFTVDGARSTDGIDVTNVGLGGRFENGLFACHTDPRSRGRRAPCPVLLVPFDLVARQAGLTVDRRWNPRGGFVSRAEVAP
jgi:3-phytase